MSGVSCLGKRMSKEMSRSPLRLGSPGSGIPSPGTTLRYLGLQSKGGAEELPVPPQKICPCSAAPRAAEPRVLLSKLLRADLLPPSFHPCPVLPFRLHPPPNVTKPQRPPKEARSSPGPSALRGGSEGTHSTMSLTGTLSSRPSSVLTSTAQPTSACGTQQGPRAAFLSPPPRDPFYKTARAPRGAGGSSSPPGSSPFPGGWWPRR